MDVVRLLQNKTRCLQRFVEESSRFLARMEQAGGREAGAEAPIEGFLDARESILRAIALFDRKIGEAAALVPAEGRTPPLKEAVAAERRKQAQWLARSAKLDERISGLLLLEITRLKREAAVQDKGRKALGRFKSRPDSGRSGQVLDHEL